MALSDGHPVNLSFLEGRGYGESTTYPVSGGGFVVQSMALGTLLRLASETVDSFF